MEEAHREAAAAERPRVKAGVHPEEAEAPPPWSSSSRAPCTPRATPSSPPPRPSPSRTERSDPCSFSHRRAPARRPLVGVPTNRTANHCSSWEHNARAPSLPFLLASPRARSPKARHSARIEAAPRSRARLQNWKWKVDGSRPGRIHSQTMWAAAPRLGRTCSGAIRTNRARDFEQFEQLHFVTPATRWMSASLRSWSVLLGWNAPRRVRRIALASVTS